MGQTVNGMRKIEALQKASLKLLKTLSDASAETESIKVSIVPFNTQVRLNAAETGANPYWVSFTGGVSAANWTGYVEDRKQPYDANDAEPRIAQDDTLYPAVARAYPLDLAPVQSLTSVRSGFAALRGTIEGMQPTGNTTITHMGSFGSTVLDQIIICDLPWVVSASEV